MLSSENTALLTQTNRGTPGGELMRRYWQPVALSEELPPKSAPIPVTIFEEDLTLFRDDQGRVGLLGVHCAHRGADLSYGRIEEGGLRCLYHGWLYDVEGNCLEQPSEPKSFKEKVKPLAYPCKEVGEIIFAYMGPGEPPEFPAYEALMAPGKHRVVSKMYHECNYLQANEGNIDPSHLSFLHRQLKEDEVKETVQGSSSSIHALLGEVTAPELNIEETPFGLRISTIRELGKGNRYLRVSNFVFPNLCAIPGDTSPDGYTINWHVPINDTTHWKYMIAYSRSGSWDKEEVIKKYQEEMTSDYRSIRNKSNRYLQDRTTMDSSFSGLGPIFRNHDSWAWDGQGVVQDRTTEHLGYSDKAIIQMRRLLLEAIKDIQEGKQPPHVIVDPVSNELSDIIVLNEMISIDPEEYTSRKIGEAREREASAK